MSTSTRTDSWQFGVPPAQLGIWVFLGVVAMLFAAFTSAYIIRRAAADWIPIELPPILWVNTAVLVASSLTLETARRSVHRSDRRGGARWLGATVLLGLAFVAGQAMAWRQLVGQGVYVPTSPHSSFFYILTGLHALHLVGGLGLLVYVMSRVRGPGDNNTTELRGLVGLCTSYWHFLGGLWIFLYLVLLYL